MAYTSARQTADPDPAREPRADPPRARTAQDPSVQSLVRAKRDFDALFDVFGVTRRCTPRVSETGRSVKVRRMW